MRFARVLLVVVIVVWAGKIYYNQSQIPKLVVKIRAKLPTPSYLLPAETTHQVGWNLYEVLVFAGLAPPPFRTPHFVNTFWRLRREPRRRGVPGRQARDRHPGVYVRFPGFSPMGR